MVKMSNKEFIVDLKSLAKEIRESKFSMKDVERYLSKLQRDKFPFHSQAEKYQFQRPIVRKINKQRYEIEEKQTEFRINHIINSLLRGKDIYQIENKLKDTEYWGKGNKHYDVYEKAQKQLEKKGFKWEIPNRGEDR